MQVLSAVGAAWEGGGLSPPSLLPSPRWVTDAGEDRVGSCKVNSSTGAFALPAWGLTALPSQGLDQTASDGGSEGRPMLLLLPAVPSMGFAPPELFRLVTG